MRILAWLFVAALLTGCGEEVSSAPTSSEGTGIEPSPDADSTSPEADSETADGNPAEDAGVNPYPRKRRKPIPPRTRSRPMKRIPEMNRRRNSMGKETRRSPTLRTNR